MSPMNERRALLVQLWLMYEACVQMPHEWYAFSSWGVRYDVVVSGQARLWTAENVERHDAFNEKSGMLRYN
jgi:hypothetical protein